MNIFNSNHNILWGNQNLSEIKNNVNTLQSTSPFNFRSSPQMGGFQFLPFQQLLLFNLFQQLVSLLTAVNQDRLNSQPTQGQVNHQSQDANPKAEQPAVMMKTNGSNSSLDAVKVNQDQSSQQSQVAQGQVNQQSQDANQKSEQPAVVVQTNSGNSLLDIADGVSDFQKNRLFSIITGNSLSEESGSGTKFVTDKDANGILSVGDVVAINQSKEGADGESPLLHKLTQDDLDRFLTGARGAEVPRG